MVGVNNVVAFILIPLLVTTAGFAHTALDDMVKVTISPLSTKVVNVAAFAPLTLPFY